MARRLPNAADVAAKWKTNFGAAGTAWLAGIESVDVAPGQLAAAALPRYLEGVQRRAPAWAANTAAVSKESWKESSRTKGPGRLASGATAGQVKFQAGIAKVLAAEASIIPSLPPRGDAIQNIQRSSAFQMAMHETFKSGS